MSLDRLAEEYPHTEVQRGVRWVDEGQLVTSAGIEGGHRYEPASGRALLGREAAETTARRMEYRWQEDER